jgi:hypothetical protein
VVMLRRLPPQSQGHTRKMREVRIPKISIQHSVASIAIAHVANPCICCGCPLSFWSPMYICCSCTPVACQCSRIQVQSACDGICTEVLRSISMTGSVQVCAVMFICTLSFCLRAVFRALATVDEDAFGLNVLKHPFLNIAFYSLVELIPAATVLFILRKLPPKRTVAPSHTPIHTPHMPPPADIEAARPVS